MDEFLRLILTGVRLQRLKRTELLLRISAAAQLLFSLPLIFLSGLTVPAAVPATLGVLIIISGILNAVLSFKFSVMKKSLTAEQISADAACADNTAVARKKLADEYLKAYAGLNGAFAAAISLIPSAVYAAAAVLSFVASLQNAEASPAVPVLFMVATVISMLTAFIPAAIETKKRTALYEKANAEITELKKCAGLNDSVIAKQSYNARNTATRSQELFLCDPADRAELRRIYTVSCRCGIALFAAFAAAIIVMSAISANLDESFITLCSSCIAATAFVIWIILAVWAEIRRRTVYKRNAAKLTDSETDKMRRFLQDELMIFQHRGNLLFSIFCGVSALVGFVLGIIGAVKDPEVSLILNAAEMSVVFFMMSGVIALVIWTFFYSAYRKRVKPVEIRLST